MSWPTHCTTQPKCYSRRKTLTRHSGRGCWGASQSQSSAAWMQTLIDDGGIVGTNYQSTQAAMDDPDLVDNGHVVSMGDDGLQIGPLARLSETPAYIRAPITDVEERLITWRQSPRSYSTAERAASPPLSGIRVIEIATIIAAPLGASMLADLGAEVIKIEPIAGDPFRSLMSGLGAMRVNAGKKSLCVNLKTNEGKRIVLDLIQMLTSSSTIIAPACRSGSASITLAFDH